MGGGEELLGALSPGHSDGPPSNSHSNCSRRPPPPTSTIPHGPTVLPVTASASLCMNAGCAVTQPTR